MTDPDDKLAQLAALAAEIKQDENALSTKREQAEGLILDLLRADVPPMEVAKASPFSDAKQRILARNAGIPPAKKGGRKL